MSQTVPRCENETTAFIEAKLASEPRIKYIRDLLYKRIGSPSEYTLSNPHITIVPPFRFDSSSTREVSRIIDSASLEETAVPVKGVSVWPSINNPRVVLLDTPVDLVHPRRKILKQLEKIGATWSEPPVNPHITLFKTDVGHTISPNLKRRIHLEVQSKRMRSDAWKTSVKYFDLNVI